MNKKQEEYVKLRRPKCQWYLGEKRHYDCVCRLNELGQTTSNKFLNNEIYCPVFENSIGRMIAKGRLEDYKCRFPSCQHKGCNRT
jgi:hypothetical protein